MEIQSAFFYLRGVYKLALGQTMSAFQDFNRLREDGIKFPFDRISTIVATLPEFEQIVLRESMIFKQSPLWADILKVFRSHILL